MTGKKSVVPGKFSNPPDMMADKPSRTDFIQFFLEQCVEKQKRLDSV
jgi:hypothetical protein